MNLSVGIIGVPSGLKELLEAPHCGRIVLLLLVAPCKALITDYLIFCDLRFNREVYELSISLKAFFPQAKVDANHPLKLDDLPQETDIISHGSEMLKACESLKSLWLVLGPHLSHDFAVQPDHLVKVAPPLDVVLVQGLFPHHQRL